MNKNSIKFETLKLADFEKHKMADQENNAGYDYERFDPSSYLEFYYDKPCKEWEELVKFLLENLHGIFSRGNISGKRLIDIGTGPAVHNIISASRHVEEIYLSDFAEQNRTTLRSWLDGQIRLQENQFSYVSELENNGQKAEDLQNELKKKIRDVLPVDVTLTTPIQSGESLGQFDILTSSWCLENASNTKEGYRACVQNISQLVKRGGYLILIGDLHSKYYMVGDVRFEAYSISNSDFQDIYKQSGFEILSWREWVKMKKDDYEYSTVVMVARKIK